MPDLATFEARERKRVNWTFGWFFGVSVIITAALIFFQKGVLLLGPLGMLAAPLFWWFQRRQLAGALSGKNPTDVVEMFVIDVNEMLANEGSAPAFAYEALSPKARNQAGDFENFHRLLRTSLTDSIESGLASEFRTGTCERCGTSFEYIRLPEDCSAGPMAPAASCSSCGRLYCSGCAPEILNRSDKCECGKKLGDDDVRIISRSRFLTPFLKAAVPRLNANVDQQEVRLDVTPMYRDTGISKESVSGGMSAPKDQAFVTGAMNLSFLLRRADERWFIDGMPTFESGPVPATERWVEAPNPFFD